MEVFVAMMTRPSGPAGSGRLPRAGVGWIAALTILASTACAEDSRATGVAVATHTETVPAIARTVDGFDFGGSEQFEDARSAPLSEYRVRVDDVVQFLFRTTKETAGRPYLLTPGDRLRLSSVTAPRLNLVFSVEPDGRVTLPVLGRIDAAGRTINDLREELQRLAAETILEPDLALTAVSIFSRLDEFQSAVSNLHSHGELAWFSKVSPDGTVQLPAIGSMSASGLTLPELQREAIARYERVLEGIHVSVLLNQRAPSRVNVLGEVRRSGRFSMIRPTSVSQAVALAGGWINGADLSRVIVFRRDSDWRLVATSLDLRDSLHGKSLENRHEIWLRDGDTILVPKTSLRRFDDAVQLVFTDGLYRLLPFDATIRAVRVEGFTQDARDVVAPPSPTFP